VAARTPLARVPRSSVACDAASMQFFRGVDESSVPDVQLMRSRTGTSGSARIIFDNPSLFQASSEMGEITGLYLVDDEVRPGPKTSKEGMGFLSLEATALVQAAPGNPARV